jgi:hypothetical protein
MRLPRLLFTAALFASVAAMNASATELRGRVDQRSPTGYVFPAAYVEVTLLSWNGSAWQPGARARTGPDGIYIFGDVAPGSHALAVSGQNYRINVLNQNFQDIPPLVRP